MTTNTPARDELFLTALHSAATSADNPEAEARRQLDAYRAEVLRAGAAYLRAEADRLWAPGKTAHTVMHADATRLDDLAEGGTR